MRIFVLICLFFIGCSGNVKSGGVQVGIDPIWYPLDFGPQTSYVNGYTEELLLEIAMNTKADYVRHTSNSDSLISGLQSGQYDAILTSLPPYNFNLAKYDFSHNFLDLGPVLIVAMETPYTELSQFNGRSVGIITNDQSVLVLQRYQEIIVRSYPSIPELLNAITKGEIEGALLPRIPAVSYINDLYTGQLKMIEKPLTDEGLRLVTLKGRNPQVIKQFNKALESMKKKKMSALMKKWQLD